MAFRQYELSQRTQPLNQGRTPQMPSDGSELVAQSALNLAKMVQGREQELQDQDDADAATEAMLQATERMNRALYLDDNAIMTRQGKNAYGAHDEAEKIMEDIRRETENSLANNRQRDAFKALFDRKRQSSLFGVARHQASERLKYREELAGLAGKSAADEAALVAYDPAQVAEVMKQSEGEIRATMSGRPEAVVNDKVAQMQDGAHTAVISRLMIKHPEAAKAYYERDDVHDKISAGNRLKIEAALEKQTRQVSVYRTADGIMAGLDKNSLEDREKAMTAVGKVDPEIRSQVEAEVENQFNDAEKIRTARETEAMGHLSKAMVTGVGLRTITESRYWFEAGEANQAKIIDAWKKTQKAEADAIKKRQDDTLNQQSPAYLHRALSAIERNEIDSDLDLAHWLPHMTPADQAKATAALAKRSEVKITDAEAAYMRVKGIAKKADIDQADFMRFYDWAEGRVEDTKRNTMSDLLDHARDWNADGYITKDKWYGTDNVSLTLGESVAAGDTASFKFETPDELETPVDIVHAKLGITPGPAKRDEFYTRYYHPATQALRARRLDPTPDRIVAQILDGVHDDVYYDVDRILGEDPGTAQGRRKTLQSNYTVAWTMAVKELSAAGQALDVPALRDKVMEILFDPERVQHGP